VSLEDVANKTAEIAAAICAKFFHGVRAKHAIALKLRFGEKLIGRALVREGFARLELFVDVAGFIPITSRFDVNDNAIGSGGTVHH